MNLRAAARNLVRDAVRLAFAQRELVARDRRNVDLVLSVELGGKDGLSGIDYPVAYVDLLRSCLEKRSFPVREIRADSGPRDKRFNRLATALEILGDDPPPIPFTLAAEIGRVADRMAGLTEPAEIGTWVADRGLHFEVSSSLGRKGRLLFNLVRLTRPERCLELGTAYGMSALFTLGALRLLGENGHLTTIERYDPPFSLAAEMLTARHGDRVACERGVLPDALHGLGDSVRDVSFMFHDASHRGENMVKDFEAALPRLAPGALVLIDDIRWVPMGSLTGPGDAYDGWRQIVAHPRVRYAVEIDDRLGLVLLT
jgi:predicted O-methyltransferase YrrM